MCTFMSTRDGVSIFVIAIIGHVQHLSHSAFEKEIRNDVLVTGCICFLNRARRSVLYFAIV